MPPKLSFLRDTPRPLVKETQHHPRACVAFGRYRNIPEPKSFNFSTEAMFEAWAWGITEWHEVCKASLVHLLVKPTRFAMKFK